MLKLKKIKLLANYILTTKEVYTEKDFAGIQEKLDGTVKEYQKVLEVGPMVRTVEVGNLVSINPKRYAITKYKPGEIKGDIEHMQQVVSYKIPELTVDGKQCLLLTDQDIEFIITEYEEEQPSNLILPKSEIITL